MLYRFLLGGELQADVKTVLRAALFSPQEDLVIEIFRPGRTVDKPACQLHPRVSLCFLLFAQVILLVFEL